MSGCSSCGGPVPRPSRHLPPLVASVKVPGEPVIFHKVVRPASMGDETVTPPEDLCFANVLLVYEASDHAYIYSSDGIPTGPIATDVSKMEKAIEQMGGKLADGLARLDAGLEQLSTELASMQAQITEEADAREQADTKLEAEFTTKLEELNAKITNEIGNAISELQADVAEEATNREQADNNLQSQIDALADRSDVVDVVNTYAELKAYDTSNLGDNDVIKVLNDETHNGAITYYRWNKAESEWEYVGETGPYYTKAETDEKLQGIDHDIENLTELMPTVVQETGASESDVMSQKAVTDAIANAGPKIKVVNAYGSSETDAISQKFVSGRLNSSSVVIGSGSDTSTSTSTLYNYSVVMGTNARSTSPNNIAYSVAVGGSARSTVQDGVAVGFNASVSARQSVALGYDSIASRQDEVSIGSGNNSALPKTRYLANVTAGELDTDATNVAQVRDMIAEAGGGGVELLDAYTTENVDGKAYSAKYINNRLDGNSVKIGSSATSSSGAIAVGASARALAVDSIVIGKDAFINGTAYTNSVALGTNSIASRVDEVSIGRRSNTSFSFTRFLANVTDGVLDQDAVTVHQLNEAVGSINTLLESLISGEGAKVNG